MDLVSKAANLVNNPRFREFTGDRRNQQLLGEAVGDLPGMWRDRGMVLRGEGVRFAAHHNHLIRLADNNHELISHMAQVTGNPTLEKVASYPRWIHFAAENPTTARIGADLGTNLGLI